MTTNQIIINLIVKIIILIALGFFLKRKDIIANNGQKGLNNLLVKAILPMSILMSSQNLYSKEAAKNMLIMGMLTGGYYLVALVLAQIISRVLKLSEKGKAVFITMVVFANVGFIGFPLAAELYGAEGTLYAVVYNICYQLIFFTYGISLLSGEKQVRIKMLYTNPVTIASVCAVFFFLLQIKIPEMIGAAFASVGNMTVPISMILIGCSLADANMKDILKDKYSYIVSFCRMFMLPAFMFLVIKFLNLPNAIAGTCVILTALPSGSLNVIYAEQYNCEGEFASRTVVQTMVFMVITIPILMILVNKFL